MKIINKTIKRCEKEDKRHFKGFLLQNDLDLEDAAAVLGISVSYLHMILEGHRVLTPELEEKIHDKLGYRF